MATATALWSPLCAPADLARQRSRSDAVSRGDSVSSRNVGLPGRSEDLLCHDGRRPCGENQRENFCSTQDKEMDRLCGQLEELLKRVGAVGPSPFILRPRDGVTQFTKSSTDNRAASDRTGEHLSRGSTGFGAPQPPTWSPSKREILDTKSHNATNGRGRDGEWPASEAAQRRRGSPEVDHFFKTKICPFIKGGGVCLRNSACTFAHSMDELRPQPSFRKTKLCRYSNAGQVCSRGENCSFAHSVGELKPLQVPPFRKKHQTISFRSSFATPAAPAAATYPAAATVVHSQIAAARGAAGARALPASAAAEPGQDSPFLGSAPASSAGRGGPWEESGNITGKCGTAHNASGCAGSPYQAQQQLLYSDLRRLPEATLESLLASVQEKGTGSALSAAAAPAARTAQKQQPSASLRLHGGETHLPSPPDRYALPRYLLPRTLSPMASTASPTGRSYPRVSPSAPECALQPRQHAQRLQQLEGVVTRLPCVQRSGRHQPPAARALEPSLQQPSREEQRRVRFVADRDVQDRQQVAATAYLPRQDQQSGFPAASATPALPCSSKPQEQQHFVAAAAAELRQSEDRSWQKKASLAVAALWHNRCRSPLPDVSNNPKAPTPENSPVSLAVETDTFCNHLATGRAVKKSRRGKRGGRKKRGAGHPAGGSGAEQQEQLYVEKRPHQEDAAGEEQTIDHCGYVERACKSSSTCGRSDRFLFTEADTHEVMKSLLQRGEGSAASTCFSEDTPSTSGVAEKCGASGVVSSGTSAEGDAFMYFLDPKQKEVAKSLEEVVEESNEDKQGAQLLLEALHAHVAAAGESAARSNDLEVAAPSLLLSAAPGTTSASPSSLLVTKTLHSDKNPTGEEKKLAASFSKEETETVPVCDQVRQLEAPQQMLTELLQGGETQHLLLQCIRDIMRQTPPASSPSEILSTLQLLSSSFSQDTAVADNPAAAGAADKAARKREMRGAAAAGGQERESGLVEKGCTIGEKTWSSDESKCPVFPAQDGKSIFSPFADFNFSLVEKEKEALNDRRTAAADLAPGAAVGAAVASILELLTDEEEGTKTGSALGQQQASTRSSSRCGVSQEEAGSLLFGGPATEASSAVMRSSVVGNRAGVAAAGASSGYVSGFFTPNFPIAATSSTSFSPWG